MKRRPHCGGRAAQLAAISVALLGALALSLGCSNAKHHRVLAFFFDGVPDPAAAVASTAPAVEASLGRQLVLPGEHGPYAAKLCNSCHDAQRASALIVPAEQLCLRCHEFDTTRAYVHGPLASGGCLVCHEPHSSPNRYLLVSASDGFCLHCHERSALSAVDGHAGDTADCTACHEAHMSDRKFLLRPGK